MKKLTICIPYNNKPQQIIRTLQSLNCQIMVNWQDIDILICISCKEYTPIDFSTFFNIKDSIKVFHEGDGKYTSAGNSRNIALKHGDSEWLWCVDAGDILYAANSLNILMRTVYSNPDPNTLYQFQEVQEYPSKLTYIDSERYEETFIHRKLFNLKRMQEENIKFCNCTHGFEDDSISLLYFLFVDRGNLENISYPLYVWTFDENSVSRVNGCAAVWKSYDALNYVNYLFDAIREKLKIGEINNDLTTFKFLYYWALKPFELIFYGKTNFNNDLPYLKEYAGYTIEHINLKIDFENYKAITMLTKGKEGEIVTFLKDCIKAYENNRDITNKLVEDEYFIDVFNR